MIGTVLLYNGEGSINFVLACGVMKLHSLYPFTQTRKLSLLLNSETPSVQLNSVFQFVPVFYLQNFLLLIFMTL